MPKGSFIASEPDEDDYRATMEAIRQDILRELTQDQARAELIAAGYIDENGQLMPAYR